MLFCTSFILSYSSCPTSPAAYSACSEAYSVLPAIYPALSAAYSACSILLSCSASSLLYSLRPADYPAPYPIRFATFPACPTAYPARPAAFHARPTVNTFNYVACQSLLFNHNLPSNYRHLHHKLMPACIFKCCQKSLFRANDFVHSEQLNGFSTLWDFKWLCKFFLRA